MPSPIEMKQCIDHCLEAHRTTLETIQYCLGQGGRHAQAAHINLLQNCVAICETSAQFMIAKSPHHSSTCATCAEVCRACADECESFDGDLQMERCAEVCRRCADSCERMSGHRVAA